MSPLESNVTNISHYQNLSMILLNGHPETSGPKPAGLVIPSVGICGPLCDVKTKVHIVLSQ